VAAPADLPPRQPELELKHGEVVALRPYTAAYRTSARGLSMTLERELRRDASGRFRLTTQGRLLVVGLSEVAVFEVDGTTVRPHSYIYQGSGLINRRREVHFPKGEGSIRSLYKGEWYEFPQEEGVLDRLSQQEQLRLWLLNDPAPRHAVTLSVADRRGIRRYRFDYAGDQTLDTPLGRVNTLHLVRSDNDAGRRSEWWLAPAWDYLTVRALHEEDGRTVETELISASIEGEPLQAQPAD
jgi:hypothetical protein